MLDFVVLGFVPGTSFQISFDFLLRFFAVILVVILIVEQRKLLKLELGQLASKYHRLFHKRLSA